MNWEIVIGLETHAQLATASKIFSGAPTAFGAAPNSQASAVDIALPGVLHRTGRYRTNGIERDHGFLKERLRPMRGLKSIVSLAAPHFLPEPSHGQQRNINWKYRRSIVHAVAFDVYAVIHHR